MLENAPKLFWYTLCFCMIYILAAVTVFFTYWTIRSDEIRIVYDKLELSYDKTEKITDDVDSIRKKLEVVTNRAKEGKPIDIEVANIEKELNTLRKSVEEHKNDIHEQRTLIPKAE